MTNQSVQSVTGSNVRCERRVGTSVTVLGIPPCERRRRNRSAIPEMGASASTSARDKCLPCNFLQQCRARQSPACGETLTGREADELYASILDLQPHRLQQKAGPTPDDACSHSCCAAPASPGASPGTQSDSTSTQRTREARSVSSPCTPGQAFETLSWVATPSPAWSTQSSSVRM